MSSAVHDSIDEILHRAVADGSVPNVVAVAADREGIVYEGAAGPRAPGPADEDVVGLDTTFRIMSMTKMVVTAAALQMAEEAKLDLGAPVEEYVPRFAEVEVLDGFDDAAPRTRPPARKATLEQLITHTSGLGYWFWESEMARWEQVTQTPNPISGSMRVFDAPLLFDPGDRFSYGLSTDWLGRCLEAVDGRTLPELVRARITGPLQMDATGFTLAEERRDTAVPVCLRGAEGVWAASPVELPEHPDWWSSGHGLYSTPRDYLRFQRMLLHDGDAPHGPRILSKATVQRAFADRIAPLTLPPTLTSSDPRSARSLELGPGYTWGHGLLINTQDEPRRRRAGTGAWAGLFNTHFWIDRATGVTGAIYSNCLPFLEPGAAATYLAFERMLYAGL